MDVGVIDEADVDDMRGLGIVFGIPYFNRGIMAETDGRIEDCIRAARRVPADANAWVFSGAKRPAENLAGVWCPGVVIWIKEVG